MIESLFTLYFILQEDMLSSKMKKLRKQKKYRGDSTLPPEFDVNIPKPRFVCLLIVVLFKFYILYYFLV